MQKVWRQKHEADMSETVKHDTAKHEPGKHEAGKQAATQAWGHQAPGRQGLGHQALGRQARAGRSFICCFLWTRDNVEKFPVEKYTFVAWLEHWLTF